MGFKNFFGLEQKAANGINGIKSMESHESIENHLEGASNKSLKEEILSNREVTKTKKLRGGGNYTESVFFKDDGSGIFKPANGEKYQGRDNIEEGTYYKRERAAFLVDSILGFDIVPPTVIREINGAIGSVQERILKAKEGYRVKPDSIPGLTEQEIKMWLFDCLIFNSDRNEFNYLVAKGKLYAIDHGLSFGNSSLYTNRDFFGKEIPADAAEKLLTFLASEESLKVLKESLLELLSMEEVEAFFVRLRRLGNLVKDYGSIPIEWKERIYQFN